MKGMSLSPKVRITVTSEKSINYVDGNRSAYKEVSNWNLGKECEQRLSENRGSNSGDYTQIPEEKTKILFPGGPTFYIAQPKDQTVSSKVAGFMKKTGVEVASTH